MVFCMLYSRRVTTMDTVDCVIVYICRANEMNLKIEEKIVYANTFCLIFQCDVGMCVCGYGGYGGWRMVERV